jgi:16S rRNA (cytosine967-C5)-methyltransferase
MTARDTAIKRLMRIETEGAFAGLVSGAPDTSSDAREERFATEITAGATRWRRWLDFVIDYHYKGDPAAMETVVRLVLRIGTYELLFLDTPPHAAINEAVELTRRHGAPRAAGLVNGILRSIDRNRGRLPEPASEDTAEALAIRTSHPTWMVRRWIERFGFEAAARLCEWNNRTPAFGIRINTLRIDPADFRARLDAESIEWEPGRFLEDVVSVRSVQPLIRGGYLADGLCVVQDESAALVVRLLDPRPEDRVLDTCAAPGGKALYAAGLMDNRGHVVALDINRKRTKLIARTAERLGFDVVEARAADATQLPAEYHEAFDRVLVDAPCSGLGVLAKRADLRWRINENDLVELATLQERLLSEAARAVRPGGVLVYSTCTIEPDENAGQIRRFLALHPDFGVRDAREFIPSEVSSESGYMATLPHVHAIDGAFAARLERKAAS